MIRIRISPPDMGKIRFAMSPLFETMASLRVLGGGAGRRLHSPWLAAARGSVVKAELDLDFLSLFAVRGGIYNPDFPYQPPTVPVPTFGDQLEALRATPHDVVRSELQQAAVASPKLASSLAPLIDNPQDGLDYLVEQLKRYWDCAFASAWRRMEATLRAELIYRSQRLGFEGPEQVLAGIHPDVALSGDTLLVEKRVDVEMELEGRGLVLIPTAFAWPDVFVGGLPPWRPFLYYPPRGLGGIWGQEATGARGTGLAALMGQGRARILLGVSLPTTTLELSERLGLAPSTVSSHLSRLHEAGLADRTRVGRRVFYQISARGRALTAIFPSGSAGE